MRTLTRLRRHITALGFAVLITAIAGTGVASAAGGFGDVAKDEYYTDAVAWMANTEITNGVELGCFGPDLSVTRGQVAAFLHRLDDNLGRNPQSASHPFVDVTATYQQAPVGWLYARGLTTGVSPTRFNPQAPITRGDFAVLVWRYANTPSPKGGSPFRDVTAGYQKEAVAWMAEQGITTGTSATTFSPNRLVSRAQAATFLYRFVDPAEATVSTADIDCTQGLRFALQTAGLTGTESRCAVPFLVDFDVAYLVAVAQNRADASLDLIIAAAAVGFECMTTDRIEDLSRLFL